MNDGVGRGLHGHEEAMEKGPPGEEPSEWVSSTVIARMTVHGLALNVACGSAAVMRMVVSAMPAAA